MKEKLCLTVFFFLACLNYSWANIYFPEKVFSENKNSNDFVVKWYSKHLAALSEDSLWEKRESKDLLVYRFLSLPTWGNPTAVTFTPNEDGTGTLIIKKTDGHGGLRIFLITYHPCR